MNAAPVQRVSADAAIEPAEGARRVSRLEVVVIVLLLGSLAALLPLYDPDLPMHLATGEWIVRNRAVPAVEPFAWTREGAPFYAYSWLPETIFYLVHRTLGPMGLRVLQGVLMLGVAASTAALGRVAGWRTGTMICLPAFAVLVAALVTPSLRPQVFLLIVVTLVWAEVERLRRGVASRWILVRLVLLSAVAANSHLFFPLVLAPIGALVAERPVRERIVALATASLVGGWLLTPYLLDWPALLATSFAPNALLAWPSPIAELVPGFAALPVLRSPVVIPALALALVPWILGRGAIAGRRRLLAAVYWSVGLLAFGFAMRLLLVWWLLVLPFAAEALDEVAAAEAPSPPRLAVRLPAYAALLVLLVLSVARTIRDWPREGTVSSRRLATTVARPAEALAGWLEPRLTVGSRGRLLTVFNYGSYLTWRLPSLSSSIDGRTVFPDSVALPEVFAIVGAEGPEPLGPWRSGDVAILPLDRRLAAVLDTAAGWQRAAEAHDSATTPATAAALWVRRAWWASHGGAPLPLRPVRLIVEP